MSAKLRLPLLLWLGGALASAADHPLDTVTRHLPTVTATTQVTEIDGSALILSANPQGTILREDLDGTFQEVPTGLPAVYQLHERDGTWCGMDGTYTSVTYGSDGWLAGGTGQTYAVSSDGTTWTTREHAFVSYYIGHEYGSWPVYSALSDVVWLTSGYHALVSVQFGSQLVVSADGIHWSQGTALAYDDFPNTPHLTAVAGKAWLWGNGSAVWSSDDWRWGAQRILPQDPSDWQALAASAERAVVLGNEGRAGWSADGEHWNFVPLPGSGSLPTAAVWAADRSEFLAVGSSGDPEAMRVWRSVDGAVWGSRLASGCRTPVGLVRGGGKYVAAMADGWILHSPDGLAWSYAAIDVPAATPWLSQPEPLQGLAYDGVRFVGVKLRGGLVVSTDGIEWTSRAGPRQYDNDVKATVCGAGGQWLYADNWNTFLSEDLGSWHLSPTGTSSRALIHAFGEFIGVGGSSLESSADGVFWTQRAEVRGITHLTPFKNTVLLAGENGLICQSAPRSEEWLRMGPQRLQEGQRPLHVDARVEG